MSKKRRMILIAGLVMSMAGATASGVVLSACKPRPQVTIEDVTGIYYDAANDCSIELDGDEFTFTMTLGGKVLSGEYTYDGTNLNLTAGSDIYTATLDSETGVISLTYENKQYTLAETTEKTLSFDTDGGSAVASQKIKPGQKGQRPADPEKSGYHFMGWYESKDYDKEFDFDSRKITADTVVYAYFIAIDAAQDVFTVTFDAGEGVTSPEAVQTINKTLYSLPAPQKAGATFIGWWMSDYQDPSKLSRKYEAGQLITQNMTLYAVWKSDAPAVTVSEEGISWISSSSSSCQITVEFPDGSTKTEVVQTTSYNSYDRTMPGEYKITITQNGNSTTVYYVNKALARVSLFKAENGKLTFNAVENAQKYLITVNCGEEAHEHTDLDLGNVTEYDFSSCSMQDGGIKFTVKAVAEGYVTSVSETFVYEKSLAALTGLKIDKDTELLTWNKVENATSYIVEIVKAGETQKIVVPAADADKGLSLKSVTGNFSVTVYAVADGYNSSASQSLNYERAKLNAPANLQFNGTAVTWTAVEGATGYTVFVGDKSFDVTEPSYTLTEEQLAANGLEISVVAKAEDSTHNSLKSDVLVLEKQLQNLSYKNGELSWSPVLGADHYVVKVNDGEETEVSAAESSAKISLTQSGKNVLYVCFASAGGQLSEWKQLEINAVALAFDSDGGEEVGTLYVEKGSALTLPVIEKSGFAFAGWYDKAGGAQAGGKKYADGMVVNGDMSLFAYWASEEYTVELVVDGGTLEGEKTFNLKFDKPFELPVPVSSDSTKVFGGWYTETNGAGFRYTGMDGKSLYNWMDDRDMKLYAGWLYVLDYKETADGAGYEVMKGAGISYVTSIQIPKEYNGKPVLEIGSGAFAKCSNLKTISIPDTITAVSVGSKGNNDPTSAFYDCTYLEAVNVYSTGTFVEGGEARPMFYDVDGVLFLRSQLNGVSLHYFPRNYVSVNGKEYVLPEGVQNLPQNIFKSITFTKITLPSTLTKISKQAFSGCYSLEEIVFAATPEGQAAMPLELGELAFEKCSHLTVVTFPERLNKMPVDIFTGCSRLTDINIEGESSAYATVDGILYSADKKTIVYCPAARETVTIPSYVDTIGKEAFKGCKNITELYIPGNVETIEASAFEGCTGLTSLRFEGADGITLTVKENAFSGCSKLTEVVLPRNLAKMEKGAFFVGAYNNFVNVTVNCSLPADAVDYAFGAFSNNNGTNYVAKLTLSNYVPKMDVAGIFGGNNLKEVVVRSENTNYKSIDGVLFDFNVTEILYYPTDKPGNYTIPETITRIGDGVFRNKKSIQEIVINKNITYIGANAFRGCGSLKKVVFEEGGTEDLVISESAFKECGTLTDITLPSRLVSIGESAFADCNDLVSIVIPEGVKEIGQLAFADCELLERISIPASAVKIGLYNITQTENGEKVETLVSAELFRSSDSSYDGCPVLKSIEVAEGNPNFASLNGVFYVKKDNKLTQLVNCPVSLEPSSDGTCVVNIPNTVEKIWNRAFLNNKTVTEVAFPDGISGKLEIGMDVFSNSKALKRILLPNGITSIGENMFKYCKALEEVFVPNTVTSIGAKAFNNCNMLSKLTFEEGGTEALVIEDGRSYSGDHGETQYTGIFDNCNNLKVIELPERTKSIGEYAFVELESLTTLKLPSTLETIGMGAFRDCRNLRYVTFAQGGTVDLVIGDYAFYYTAISGEEGAPYSLVLPENCVKIGNNAFHYVSGMKSVYIPAAVKEIGTYAFGAGSKKELTTVEFAPESRLEKLGESAFSEQKSLKSINLGDCKNLKEIGYSAFKSCSSLTSITIPASVELLGAKIFQSSGSLSKTSGVFRGCTSLSQVEFGTEEVEVTLADGSNVKEMQSSVKEIMPGAFANTAITSFEFPISTNSDGIKLGEYLFESCDKLNEIHLSRSVKDITNVFANCVALRKISIAPDNENFKSHASEPLILNMEETAIRYSYGALPADNEGTYTIPDGFTEIGARAFEGQSGIKKISLPESIKVIGEYAFTNCRSLEEVQFRGSNSALMEVRQYAFANCCSLKSIKIPDRCKTIGKYAFTACSSMETATLPQGLVFIGEGAFQVCTSLKTVNLRGLSPKPYVNNKGVATPIENCVYASDKAGHEENAYGVGKYVFNGCISLETVNVSEGVKTLGAYMFCNCTSLKTIKLPESLVQLGEYTFMFSGLEYIEISSGVKNLYSSSSSVSLSSGSSAFWCCANLQTVTLPYTLEYIGAKAFRLCTSLTTVNYRNSNGEIVGADNDVTLPESVKMIGNNAFEGSGLVKADLSNFTNPENLGTELFLNCENLKTVTLNARLTELKNKMFSGCTLMDTLLFKDVSETLGEEGKLTFPASMTFLGNYTFKDTGFTTVEIPSTLPKIGSSKTSASSSAYTFQDCAKLTTVILPSNFTEFAGHVFSNCENLNTVQYRNGTELVGEQGKFTLPATVTRIYNQCFENCGFTELSFSKPITNMGSKVFQNSKKLTKVEIGGNFKAGGSMFLDCTALTEVIYTSTATTANSSVFQGCTALEEVDLSKAKVYGSSMFKNCTSLSSVKLSSTVKAVANYMFDGCTALGSINLPDAVNSIGEYAFRGCTSITNIALPSAVKLIGKNAFENSGLTNITIPEAVTYFGSNKTTTSSSVFKGCTSLTTVNLHDKLVSINGYTFQNCPNLKNIEIPASVTLIGTSAFQNSGIESVTIPKGVTTLLKNVFEGCSKLTDIQVASGNTTFSVNENGDLIKISDGSVVASKAIEGDGEVEIELDFTGLTEIPKNMFKGYSGEEKVVIPEGITVIGEGAFQDSTIKEVILPSTLKEIGDDAFNGTKLEKLVLPEGLEIVGDNAFANTPLTSVTFPKTITKLPSSEKYAPFVGCVNLSEIILPEGMTYLGDFTFAKLPALTEVTVPSTLTKIGEDVFAYNENLVKVTLTDGLKLLGEEMFGYCPKLTEIKIPDSVKELEKYIFRDTGIVNVTLPAGITTVTNQVFRDCSALEKVTLPEGVELIDSMAFMNCVNLKEINIPSTVTKINSEAFSGCTSLEELVLPEGLETIGSKCFSGCTSLKKLVIPASVITVTAGVSTPSSTASKPTVFEGLFTGWTEEQEIEIHCKAWEIINWGYGWRSGCKAKITVICDD